MADVEALRLQVTGDSQSAEQSINSLIDTLGRLETATKGGCGLGSLSNSLQRISTAVNSMGGAGQKLTDLANGLTAISNVGKAKISSNIANQLTAINTAIRDSATVDYSSITRLSTALQPLTSLGKGGLGTLISQLKNLPTVAAELNKVDITSFTAKINQLAAAMRPLANEMQKVANGFSAFPAKIQTFMTSSAKVPTSNIASALSFARLAAKVRIAIFTVQRIGRVVASWINESNRYIEDTNLFTVAMGEYAESAKEYANEVSEVMGIDPADWMRNQGVFMTLASGFGVATDRAAKMSEQLTQLGYDISSFYNISVSDAMTKLQSGLSGELEPLRRIGYDLSQAKLQATAASLGIDKLVSSMTQAEKAELRYYAIMTQVTQVQGDMARTLTAPANQLRVLKSQATMAARALGDLFIPALNAIIPYAIAALKVITMLAQAIASLFGLTLKVDFSGVSAAGESAGGAIGDIPDDLEDAAGSANKLKKILLGIDELNVLPDTSGAGGGGGVGGVGGGGFDFELPEYDFLENAVTTKVGEIVDKIKEWLGITGEINSMADLFETKLGKIISDVVAIGAALIAWKISKSVVKALNALMGLKGFTFTTGFIGLAGFLSDLNELSKYVQDFLGNGATFHNVAGMISEFAGAMGDAFILLGQLKIGGVLKVIQGIGEVVVAIEDISNNGVNWENANTTIRGLTNIAIGIGVFTKHMDVAGWAMAIQGFTAVITEIADNWEAIKSGDWSGVDKATLAIGAIEAIGGIVIALGLFSKIKNTVNTATAAQGVSDVANATTAVSTATSNLTSKLTTLIKDLALGIVIIAEVAVAAGLIVGAIWVLGLELEQVGIAWEPVLANGETVLTALGLGTVILVAVGVATALLGTLGGSVCGQIGIGIAVLAELGVAAALFIAEIWGIGKGLDEIGKAWDPVLKNGEDIAKAIGIGTGLLVGIGVVTAALGMATVATAGALPAAIALGTAILVELAVAFIVFTESLIDVADQLEDELHPALKDLSAILPGLTTNMQKFTDFMIQFVDKIIIFTATSTISGIASTVNKVVGFFTANPIKTLRKEVDKQCGEMEKLVETLEKTIPVLQDADRLMAQFNSTMDSLNARIGADGKGTGTIGYTITVGVELAKSGWTSIQSWIGDLTAKLKIKLPTVVVTWASSGGPNTVTIPKFTVKYYAQGGFPGQDGQLFVANEAGPELVGTIGNRNAVVNNDQIVESVSQGVYQAVARAMGESGGQVVEAKVNDKVLFEVIVNRNRQETMRTGYSPLLGGV